MRLSCTIVTTLAEYVEVETTDEKVQTPDIPELFQKILLTLSPKRHTIFKTVQYMHNPALPSIPKDQDQALALALSETFTFDTDAHEMKIFRDKLAAMGLTISSTGRESE